MQSPAFPDQPFTRHDLGRLGISRSRLDRAVAAGEVRHLIQGVYLRADVPDSVDVRAAAARLVLDDQHAVVDRSAAWLYGIDLLTWPEHDLVPALEVCALRGRNPTDRTGLRGRSRDLSPGDVGLVAGVRVTTPLRTALDLGCSLRRRDAFAALVLFARLHGVSRADLTGELSRFRGRRGVRQLRPLIPVVDARLESAREAWTLLAILDEGLPCPEPQWWIEIDGVPTYRLDFAYPRARVCVEYDGFDSHERTEAQRRHDQARRAWLRANGWTVIVVRNGDFTGERLQRWLRELAEALRSSYDNRRW